MKQHEMKQIFKNTIKGGNFMTPNVVRYEDLGSDYIAEVSSGSGMLDHDQIYGVTVISKIKDQWIKVDGVNRCHRNMISVEQHLTQLKQHIQLVEAMSMSECLILIEAVEVVKSLDEIEQEILNIDSGV